MSNVLLQEKIKKTHRNVSLQTQTRYECVFCYDITIDYQSRSFDYIQFNSILSQGLKYIY